MLPVSQYEALLAEVRSLRKKTQDVQQLARPLISSSSSLLNRGHLSYSSPQNVKVNAPAYFYSSMEEPDSKRSCAGGSGKAGNEIYVEPESEIHFNSYLPVTSEPSPKSPNNCNPPMLYHGMWPIENENNYLWNSDPSKGHSMQQIGHNFNNIAMQDVSSVMSFASSSGGVPLEHALGSPNLSRRSSQQQLDAKVDMVYSLLAMLSGQEHADMGDTLLALSTSPESCLAMRESGCIPLLVQMVQSDREPEARRKAAVALQNLVNSQPDERLRKGEVRILKLLEQARFYAESVVREEQEGIEMVGSEHSAEEDKHPVQTIAHLMKLSFDELHRHAICQLGGIHVIANLVEVEHALHGSISNEAPCIVMRRYACMALTNLTFGDSGNKALLCSFQDFMKALVMQLQSCSDEMRQVTASVLRNLSWRADSSSKSVLREVGSVTGLMKCAMLENNKENTLKSILSALWNLSAHCTENKSEICSVDSALGFLVDLLNQPNSLPIIENSGGILRNISSQIAVREDYRDILRHHNCLQILLEQLKSPSLTIVSNACGTLWNLSAKCVKDQEILWELGAPSMLRSLSHSKHKMIAMGSSAALKNLLSAKPNQAVLPSLDSTAKAMDLPVLPTLGVRKQKALLRDLDQSLTETYENVDRDSPVRKTSLLSADELKNDFCSFTVAPSTSCVTSGPSSLPNVETHPKVNRTGIPVRNAGQDVIGSSGKRFLKKPKIFVNKREPSAKSSSDFTTVGGTGKSITVVDANYVRCEVTNNVSIDVQYPKKGKEMANFSSSDEKDRCSIDDASNQSSIDTSENNSNLSAVRECENWNNSDILSPYDCLIHPFPISQERTPPLQSINIDEVNIEDISMEFISKFKEEDECEKQDLDSEKNRNNPSLEKMTDAASTEGGSNQTKDISQTSASINISKDDTSITTTPNSAIPKFRIPKRIITNSHKKDDVAHTTSFNNSAFVASSPYGRNGVIDFQPSDWKRSCIELDGVVTSTIDDQLNEAIDNSADISGKERAEVVLAENRMGCDLSPVEVYNGNALTASTDLCSANAKDQKSAMEAFNDLPPYQSPAWFANRDRLLERSCEESNVVAKRMLDPDAMIESLERFTAVLVSQAASHLQNKDKDSTWNDDTSRTFPSMSGSIPDVITFAEDSSGSGSASDEKVPQIEEAFSSVDTSTMTQSTLIAMEAAKMASVFETEAQMTCSLELDKVQPPSLMDSINSEPSRSPKLFTRRRNVSMVRKLLSGSLNNGSSLESLEHSSISDLDQLTPSAILGEVLDMTASGTSFPQSGQSTNFVINGAVDHRNLVTMLDSTNVSNIVETNPPSLFQEITDLCHSLADIPTQAIGTETEMFEDCFTHVAQTEDDFTEFSDANSMTPIQSDPSSPENSPHKKKSHDCEGPKQVMTSKQKRNLARDRYKTYTVAAEMVMREDASGGDSAAEEVEELRSEDDNVATDTECASVYKSVVETTETLYNSPTYSLKSKMTSKERRQVEPDRFQTRVIDPAVIEKSKEPPIDSQVGSSPTGSPARSRLSIRRSFMQKRLENKDRFKTQTLNEPTMSPDLSESPDSDMHMLVEKEARLVLKSLQETGTKADDLLDCETLSLVSNDDDSEHISINSINYPTYRKSLSTSKSTANTDPIAASSRGQVQKLIITNDQEQDSEKKVPKIIKIVKPTPARQNQSTTTTEEQAPKGIRGRRKPLYSKPVKMPSKTSPKPPLAKTTVKSNLVKNVTSTIKSVTKNRPVTATTNRSSVTSGKASSGYISQKSSPSKSQKAPDSLERQGTFTKDHAAARSDLTNSKIPLPGTSKIPKVSRIPTSSIPTYGRSTSVESKSENVGGTVKKSINVLQNSASSQGLQRASNSCNSIPLRSGSSSSLKTTAGTKKQVTSKIASLWKKIEECKNKQPDVKKDTRVWIQSQTTCEMVRSHTFDNKEELLAKRGSQNQSNDSKSEKRISRLGSFIVMDDASGTSESATTT